MGAALGAVHDAGEGGADVHPAAGALALEAVRARLTDREALVGLAVPVVVGPVALLLQSRPSSVAPLQLSSCRCTPRAAAPSATRRSCRSRCRGAEPSGLQIHVPATRHSPTPAAQGGPSRGSSSSMRPLQLSSRPLHFSSRSSRATMVRARSRVLLVADEEGRGVADRRRDGLSCACSGAGR